MEDKGKRRTSSDLETDAVEEILRNFLHSVGVGNWEERFEKGTTLRRILQDAGLRFPEGNGESVLDEAAQIVDGPRREAYGHPKVNHGRLAQAWNAYLSDRDLAEKPLTSRDICNMMVLLKVMREAHAPKRDNLVDIAGWARNAEIVSEGGTPK